MKLSDLPQFDFVNADKDAVFAKILSIFKMITGRTPAKGDPIRLFLLVIANIFVLAFNKINHTGKSNLLAFSNGAALEHLGAPFRVERLQATGATTTVRITASTTRPEGIQIPKGTRFTAGDSVMFATTEPYLILSGNTQIDVKSECQTVGEIGNGYSVGSINTLVDPIPFVASVENITVSEGGSGIEDDDAYRERIHEAPESFSVAGSTGAYKYHTKSVSKLISDVTVTSPKPGQVVVYPILSTGELAGAEILKAVNEKLSDRYLRPLTDNLSVKAPNKKEYSINVTYFISQDNQYVVEEIRKRVSNAVDSFISWQKEVAGRDINPSELTKRMVEAGAKRVEIASPIFTYVKNGKKEDGYVVELAFCNSSTVTFGGIERE